MSDGLSEIAYEFIVVYCHGERKIARYIGDGYAICPCGQKLRVVT